MNPAYDQHQLQHDLDRLHQLRNEAREASRLPAAPSLLQRLRDLLNVRRSPHPARHAA
ncbi:hypothetical protein [Deinococcus sonorensis]|uniref:Uncharacterized protein n=2 Tax=Deinococcus sonorensis TaxID=309891 RepID=A0AAU7U9Q0_9DEIO